jgi:hypothetical protein
MEIGAGLVDRLGHLAEDVESALASLLERLRHDVAFTPPILMSICTAVRLRSCR